MADQPTNPLTAEREQEIRDSIPTVYAPPWTVHPDMDTDVWRVLYATDHPLAGLVCEVPDYGAHLAEFIATARAAVPELLDELDRLRALPELLETVLTERFTDTGNPYARMVWHEEAPDGYPSTHAVSPVKVAAVLRELISTGLAVEEQPAEACGKCKTPFDPTDTRFDGRARYAETPYCRRCIDGCHESTDAFHRCVICDGEATR